MIAAVTRTGHSCAPDAPGRRAATRRHWQRRSLAVTALLALIAATGTLASGSAWAATPAPGWTLDAVSSPTNFSSTENELCLHSLSGTGELQNPEPACNSYILTATDAGARETDGSEITLAATVPPGVTAQQIALRWEGPGAKAAGAENTNFGEFFCEVAAVRCTVPLTLQPDDFLIMRISVTVNAPGQPAPLTATGSVSGGGAPEAGVTIHNAISPSAPAFGAAGFGSFLTGEDGTPETQAAGHPYELTTRIDLATKRRVLEHGPAVISVEELKDAVVDLPLGFVGSTLAAPQCNFGELVALANNASGCPPDTIVGHIRTETALTQLAKVDSPIFNMVPSRGLAAEFGFVDGFGASHILSARVVPGPTGYRLQVTAPEAPQIPLADIITTFFGNPAAKDASGNAASALFTNPANCDSQPLTTTLHLDSWEHPGSWNPDGTPNLSDPNWVTATTTTPPVTGCDLLQFEPAMSALFETSQADSPTGLNLELKLPQTETPTALATPPLRNAVVTLPPGVSPNPSLANGLQACSPEQIALDTAAEPTCPNASKIGTVELTTPVLPGTLVGSVFLATQDENPFHTLLAGYIVVNDPTTGIVIKVPGRIDLDPTTGQITGTFDENPQFPFTDLKLHLFGGPRGDLATPESCGTFTTTSTLTPWSFPDSGPTAPLSEAFDISGGCVTGFAPSFTAGTVSPTAAAFSPLTVVLARTDQDQDLSSLTVQTPPGLLGKLAGIPLCVEPQAAQGTCPAASQIGHVTVAAGTGPTPVTVPEPGKPQDPVYLTGPYKGAPFGLSVVVPAQAGPFNLGTVVVRSTINIDQHTGQVTIASDPFPTILHGIPLKVRKVDVTIDRGSFTFNPTSCEPMSINATVTSTHAVTAGVSTRFQAANCANLPFTPAFSASTSGRTSKVGGASLKVKISSAGIGQAGIAKVDLTIPSILPSRLTTLQKACLAKVFDENPAKCPSESNIATATVHTPLLNSPLSGPVYFVSHGDEAFPETEIVLQGEGVELVLEGHTDIKAGVTYSRFESVPDAPFTSFEFNAPEGPYSIFAANADLCQNEVRMPTRIVAQNGSVLEQDTLVEPEGCPNAITILSHTVRGRTLTLKVAVPGAGMLSAAGKHLRRASKTAGGRGVLTLTLKATGRGRLNTKVRLIFTPTHGPTLITAISAKSRR